MNVDVCDFLRWMRITKRMSYAKKGELDEIHSEDFCAADARGRLARAEELRKLSLDDAFVIGTTIQTDTQVKAEGKASIKVTTQWPTTICLGEVVRMDIENAKLVYKAKVKSDLDGTAFLEMWAHVGGGQYFSRGMNDVVSRKSDWKMIQTPFLFQKGQKPEKVTLNLVINGKGTVWIDDITLSKEPLQ